MPVSLPTLRMHMRYSQWASGRVLDAAAELTPDELNRDFHTADKSVAGTLAHIFAADRIWLERLNGSPRAVFLAPEERELSFVREAWPEVFEGWHTFLGALRDGGESRLISYRDLKGNAYEQPVWAIVLHVVNHATHHRGAISGFLRSMGRTPPPLDLIAYYRGLDAGALRPEATASAAAKPA